MPAPRPEPVREPTVVRRPEPEAPRVDSPRPIDEDRAFWMRHRLFVRHPRALGAALVVLGALATGSNVDVLLHGGFYWAKLAPLGPLALCVGVWPLAFGCPIERSGPPAWWKIGYAISIVFGFAAGLTLLWLLSAA